MYIFHYIFMLIFKFLTWLNLHKQATDTIHLKSFAFIFQKLLVMSYFIAYPSGE